MGKQDNLDLLFFSLCCILYERTTAFKPRKDFVARWVSIDFNFFIIYEKVFTVNVTYYIFWKSRESSISISKMPSPTIAGIDNKKEYVMACSLSSSSFLF